MAIATDAYAPVQAELDAALSAATQADAAAACRRALLALARIATGPDFDHRRHRAIAAALRDRTRGTLNTGIQPLTTRGRR